ncbi:hypothetical protein [Ligilactobacillus faecis]|uniref:hypothetical protein n=1 Tax=Ligilactobacillus faecis TaxID=762833 RepID=UPI00351612DC
MAKEFSEDYLWIMDDDVYPEPDCLGRCAKSKCFYIPRNKDGERTDRVDADGTRAHCCTQPRRHRFKILST